MLLAAVALLVWAWVNPWCFSYPQWIHEVLPPMQGLRAIPRVRLWFSYVDPSQWPLPVRLLWNGHMLPYPILQSLRELKTEMNQAYFIPQKSGDLCWPKSTHALFLFVSSVFLCFCSIRISCFLPWSSLSPVPGTSCRFHVRAPVENQPCAVCVEAIHVHSFQKEAYISATLRVKGSQPSLPAESQGLDLCPEEKPGITFCLFL